MNEFIKNLSALVEVKTIVAFAVVAVFVVLSLSGVLAPDVVMTIVTMIVAFYFGPQSEKKSW